MVTVEKAKELLSELNRASVQVTHQCNSPQGLTKKAMREEFNAARAIYIELTGVPLSEQEWNEITN